MYNTKMESIKEAMKNSKAIALTPDFWTSLGNESYCGIICHWITDGWNLKSVVLNVCMSLNVTILPMLLSYINSLRKTGI